MSTNDTPPPELPAFARHVDLAAEKLGGRALHATDEFFAEKENLLKADRGVFVADKYTDRGKWMDGWESRRRRGPGHDFCVVRLGAAGIVRGLDIDTNHFTGNFPEHASVEACAVAGDVSVEELLGGGTRWKEILPISRLGGGSHNFFAVDDKGRYTHVRLHIYPDGGVARLRVHGEVVPDFSRLATGALIDLAAVDNGGVVELANDMYFGRKDNLIMPGEPANMGDGWETRRKRGPGNDWLIVRLGAACKVRRVEIDTTHFKGNFPDRCSLEGLLLDERVPPDFLASRSLPWQGLLPSSKLGPDRRHVFESELAAGMTCSHVRLSIYPDGGVARLRIFGTLGA